jgi:putative oxidoreductase
MQFLKNDDLAKLILRLGVGILLFFHGVAKIGNAGTLGFIKAQLASHGLPEMLVYGVFVGEIIAPVLLVLGLYSRLGGLLVFGNMLFVFGLVHTGELFSLSSHGGWGLELQGLYLVGGLAIMFLGSGKFAVKAD